MKEELFLNVNWSAFHKDALTSWSHYTTSHNKRQGKEKFSLERQGFVTAW